MLHVLNVGCVAEVALDDRKIELSTRLGALDFPRSSARKTKEFVRFHTLFNHTHTSRSFSVLQDSKSILLVLQECCIGDLLQVMHWYLHYDWLSMRPDDSDQLKRSSEQEPGNRDLWYPKCDWQFSGTGSDI